MKTKKLTLYVANDGSEFRNEDLCKAHDNLLVAIEKIESNLKPLPKDDSEFRNGGGYIQQNKKTVTAAKKALLSLGIELKKIPENCDFEYAGRYFNDQESVLYGFWGRLANIDGKAREWDQGYFGINPDKGVQKEIK